MGKSSWLLFVVSVLISGCYSNEVQSPPRLDLTDNLKSKPVELDNPEHLLIPATYNGGIGVDLTCEASNAEDIYWKFTKNLDAAYDDLPAGMTEGDAIPGLKISKRLSHTYEPGVRFTVGVKLNGYYACFATNKFGFITVSPPLRIVFPGVWNVVEQKLVTPDDNSNIDSTQVGNMYSFKSLPCLQDSKLWPEDVFLSGSYNFQWFLFDPEPEDDRPLKDVKLDNRVFVNERTGELFFKYLRQHDGTGVNVNDPHYRCVLFLGGSSNQIILAKYKLTVAAGTSPNDYTLEYPKRSEDRQVKCLENSGCYLSCVFGGSKEVNSVTQPPPNATFELAGFTPVTTKRGTNFITFDGVSDAEGTWKCRGGDIEGSIMVDILNYPTIDNLNSQFAQAGDSVTFECTSLQQTGNAKFYYNGTKLETDSYVFIDYDDRGNKFSIPSVQREYSASISCLVKNEAGINYETVQLNVYDKPMLALTPKEVLVRHNVTKDIFTFHCDTVLDTKATQAEIIWTTDLESIGDDRLNLTPDFKGLTGLSITTTTLQLNDDETSQFMNSTVQIQYDDTNEGNFPVHTWNCRVEFMILNGGNMITLASDGTAEFIRESEPEKLVAVAGFPYWVLGIVAAVIFFIILLLLIICCVQRNKGEQYYVDEKERKAGHNPEEELQTYGFQDYKRPDQNPVKGSRASMDISDKPMDSDTGSMDQYGDIDTHGFNEEGSFIGQYGQRRNQADV